MVEHLCCRLLFVRFFEGIHELIDLVHDPSVYINYGSSVWYLLFGYSPDILPFFQYSFVKTYFMKPIL